MLIKKYEVYTLLMPFIFRLDLSSEPVFDWEEYIEPKEEQKMLIKRLGEMQYRNM